MVCITLILTISLTFQQSAWHNRCSTFSQSALQSFITITFCSSCNLLLYCVNGCVSLVWEYWNADFVFQFCFAHVIHTICMLHRIDVDWLDIKLLCFKYIHNWVYFRECYIQICQIDHTHQLHLHCTIHKVFIIITVMHTLVHGWLLFSQLDIYSFVHLLYLLIC